MLHQLCQPRKNTVLLKIQNFQPGGFQLVLVNPAVCVVRAADRPFFGKFDVLGKVKAPAIVVFIIPAAKFRHNDFVGSAVI